MRLGEGLRQVDVADLVDELELCRNAMGLSDEQIASLARNSFMHSGAPQEVKSAGVAAVDAWLDGGPLVS